MAAVNTLKQQLTNVTGLQVSSLTPGTVVLILGSDFTELTPVAQPSASGSASASGSPSASGSAGASGNASASGSPSASASPSPSGSAVASLAQNNNGITAAASCASDGSAFSGPLSP
jgi:hypothetical protein